MMKDKEKVKLIVKTFLCANKGKWYSSKELADFINNNKLGVKGGISPTGLSKLFHQHDGIDRRRKNHKSVWEYGINGS